jgi:hypothetical protein
LKKRTLRSISAATTDIRRLIERLDARRAQGGAKLIALLGSSGSGKSSLLRAGVVPRLKRAGRNWIVTPPMRPRLHPADELAVTLAGASGPGADWRKLKDDLLRPDPARALADFANDLRVKAGAGEAQILIPIDQGEELFGVADPDEARRFLEVLSQALSESLPFMAVMALRSDFLGRLQSAAALTARFEEFSLGAAGDRLLGGRDAAGGGLRLCRRAVGSDPARPSGEPGRDLPKRRRLDHDA